MRKAILSLFTVLLLSSCGGNTPADKICGFFEKATEKVEKATTINELDDINKKLMQNIAVYSISLTQEQYDALDKELKSNKELDNVKFEYEKAQNAKKKELKGE